MPTDLPLAVRSSALAHLPHPVQLGGLRAGSLPVHDGPLLVERSDQNFIDGLLDDLRQEATRDALKAPRTEAGALRLYPPVQRVFTLAVLEAWCQEPGRPRLEATRIASAGLVLRRAMPDGTRCAWIKAASRVHGWEAVDEDADPAADKRRPAASVGQAFLDGLLPSNTRARAAGVARFAGSGVDVTEAVIPLFVAPPDVCAAARKTLLFAAVPVTSDEQSEGPASAPRYGQTPEERADLQGHLVNYLKSGGPRVLPQPVLYFSSAWVQTAVRAAQGSVDRTVYDSLDGLQLLLQQLHLEFDAFGTSTAARAMFDALNLLKVEYDATAANGHVTTTQAAAGAFLKAAYDTLLDMVPDAGFTMPHRFAYIDDDTAAAVFDASLQALDAQYLALKPAKGRFEADSSDAAEPRYVLRAFIRLKPERKGCPGQLVWSGYSGEFTIAPWYESSGAAPALVPLPDLFDRNLLKKLKPNVAFVVPPKLAALLKKDPKKLRDGDDQGGGIDLMWICSFSIPIITLCAFIVLNIFLSLFALIFFWLPTFKICIPFPKKR